jgi:hypothetical protein
MSHKIPRNVSDDYNRNPVGRVYRVTVDIVMCDGRAGLDDVEALIHDLTWVGGCRNPDDDPAFSSLEILGGTIVATRKKRKYNG